MTLTKEQIKNAALKLEPGERETLAEELLLSIGNQDREAIDAAWLAEAHRRNQSFLSGATDAKPVDEVVARIRNGVRR